MSASRPTSRYPIIIDMAAPKTILCLIDKAFPPEESFIDGLLSSLVPVPPEVRVIMIVSRGSGTVGPRRYGKAVCLPILLPRRGIGRFLNLPLATWVLSRLIRRERKRGRGVGLFVRNEPIYLTAAALAKPDGRRLVFQQTFPHERAGHSWIKRQVARWLMRINSRSVDALSAVSPLGMKRLATYFRPGTPGLVIPLLTSADERISDEDIAAGRDETQPLRIIYSGQHAPERELETLIEAIAMARAKGIRAVFDFVGGFDEEIATLRLHPETQLLERDGVLRFWGRLPRAELIRSLSDYHVGLSLIPPTDIFAEASPTKLVEYMGARLAVLASYGIPMQEDLVRDSGAGLLAGWSPVAICAALLKMDADRKRVEEMGVAGLRYAQSSLNYSDYRSPLMALFQP